MKRNSFILMADPVRKTCIAGFVLSLAMARTAAAHSDTALLADHPWSAWQFTPDIVIVTLLAAVFYGTGLWRARNKQQEKRLGHGIFFYAGLASIFLALQSPIDTLAEHVFAMHQLQHLLLHSLGPMLLMLSSAEGPLIAGMPEWLRRQVLTPVLQSRAVRATFGFLTRPVTVTVLYVGSLYFWQIPYYHEIALLDESVHYLMHISMLFTGLLFFWRVFDPRPAPLGAGFGTRLVMLCATITGNILIGSVITLKSMVLYPAYDTLGRLWNLKALTDELVGGIVIWIPGSMMCVIAVLIVISLWGDRETKTDVWRRREALAGMIAASGPSPLHHRRSMATQSSNRTLALKLLTISLTVLSAVVAIAILDHYSVL